MDINLRGNKVKDVFVLNYTRYSINVSKRNHHLRASEVTGLARLDLDGPIHRNPDGQEIGPRHLHLYREDYGLQWAIEVPEHCFSNLDDAFVTLEDFMKFCNIVDISILGSLFK